MLGNFIEAKDIGNFERFIKVLESAKNLGDSVLDVLPVIFVLTSREGQILKANIVAQKFFELAEEDILGRNLSDLVPASAAATLRELFRGEVTTGQGMREIETRHLDSQNQEKFTFWNIGSLARSDQLTADVHLILASDVTQLRQSHFRLIEVDKELAISKAIQDQLLPASDRFENDDFRIRGYYRAADRVSGDWWWYDLKSDRALTLLLGDVTGHGIGAAMVTAKIASIYSVISRKADVTAPMLDLLTDLNASVCAVNDAHFAASLFGMRIDPKAGVAECCFCGCGPVMFFRQGKPFTSLQRGGRLIGWQPEPLIGHHQVPFVSGDRLFACTDGAFEFKDKEGQKYSVRRLFRLVESLSHLDIDALSERLAEEIAKLRGHQYLDDMSFVVVERK